MKRTIYMIFSIIMAAVMMFSFTACNNVNGGQNGKSAYQIWLDEGHSGSEADFLDWLKGTEGKDGKSAYEIWLQKGNTGTETDFFNWLKDSGDQESGLSAYELYKKHNSDYNGSEEQWLDDLANGVFAKYTVTFNSNGGTEVFPLSNLVKGQKLNEPPSPYKNYYTFAGWYIDRSLTIQWFFDTDVVLSDTVLYAKWVKSQNLLLFTPISDTTCSVTSNWNLDGINEVETFNIPETATINGIEYTVTKIESDAFSDLYNLKVIILPETVTEIENSAFWGCDNLRTIYMPKVKSVGYYAFGYCGKLENIFLPSSLTSVERFMFRYYDYDRNYPLNIHIEGNEASAAGWIQNLGVGPNSNIIYNSAYTSYDDMSFITIEEFAATVPVSGRNEYVVSIGSESRSSIQTLNLPPVYKGKLVTRILSFSDCISLENVVLPATVKVIQPAAFYSCKNLEGIDLSDTTHIGNNAFALCPRLKKFIIPPSVTSVGEGVFAISGQTREKDLIIYVDADQSQTLSWSNKWMENSGGNITVNYGWLTQANITFESNGGNVISARTARKGSKLTDSLLPYKDNYTFAGWYKDAGLTTKWDFDSDIVIEDIILYAAWTEGEEATKGLSYAPIKGGAEYKVSKGTADLTGRIVISPEYDGKPVTAIDIRAFSNLNILGEYANITSVNIPDSITDLGVQSFYGNTLIESVTIPAGVTEIGSAFDNCSSITSIKVSENNETLFADNNCVIRKADNVLVFSCRTGIIPDYVKGIGDSAFSGCEWLTSIKIPYGVEFIDKHAFLQCHNLKTVIIPDTVQSIGKAAFWNCVRLTNINIPYGITVIEANTFEACYNLISITIPDTVEFIDWCAFASTGLTSIIIPDSVTSIDHGVFDDCVNLKSVIISDSVTSMGVSFAGCISLTYVKLPSGLERIEVNSFNDCTSLTTITLPQGLKEIAGSTFVDCTSLKSVVIPSGVTYIGNSAFSGCESLETIYYGGSNLSEWNAIEKSYLGSEFLSAAKFYYSESRPATSGNYWHFDADGVTPIKW